MLKQEYQEERSAFDRNNLELFYLRRQLSKIEKIRPNIIYNRDHWEAKSKNIIIASSKSLEELFNRI